MRLSELKQIIREEVKRQTSRRLTERRGSGRRSRRLSEAGRDYVGVEELKKVLKKEAMQSDPYFGTHGGVEAVIDYCVANGVKPDTAEAFAEEDDALADIFALYDTTKSAIVPDAIAYINDFIDDNRGR
jgi:hypothetical protein